MRGEQPTAQGSQLVVFVVAIALRFTGHQFLDCTLNLSLKISYSEVQNVVQKLIDMVSGRIHLTKTLDCSPGSPLSAGMNGLAER